MVALFPGSPRDPTRNKSGGFLFSVGARREPGNEASELAVACRVLEVGRVLVVFAASIVIASTRANDAGRDLARLLGMCRESRHKSSYKSSYESSYKQ